MSQKPQPDPLSRVIYTQAQSALKPLRTASAKDKKALSTTVSEHKSHLSTLVSTITAADTDGLSESQKLALNLGKIVSVFSQRLTSSLQRSIHRPTVCLKRPATPPPVQTAPKRVKEEPMDDEPCCSTSINASTNDTLSSLLNAQLRNIRQESEKSRLDTMLQRSEQRAAPATTKPVTVVRRPGAPVQVVVANRARNGEAARVVVVRRPPHPNSVTASRPTVSTTQPIAAGTRHAVSSNSATVTTAPPKIVPAIKSKPLVIVDEHKLSKRLLADPHACFGCRAVEKPEKHPPHACPFCGLVIEGAERVEHVKDSHPDRYNGFAPFMCILKECDYRTISRRLMRGHCLAIHSPLFDKWELQGRFKFDCDTVCPLCPNPIPLDDIKQLRMHARIVHEMMPAILCGSCCETCTTTAELFEHWVQSPLCDGNAKLLDCREESFLALFT